jgi:hypothetical protein
MARKFTFTTQVYDKKTDFPATGDVDVIYIDASTNKAYRYDESYYNISSSNVNVWGALGSISKGGTGASWGSITGTLSSQTDLQTALDAKQNTLVSGTNIKTINSTSLLGSGDVAVQPTLVSGTNIKTINGSSVLGSGNLSISGGLQGISNIVPIVSGDIISPAIICTANTNATSVANRMTFVPFIVANDLTISNLFFSVNAAGIGANGRILIYSDLNGKPYSKLYESSNLDCSTTGSKTTLTSFTFNAGTIYWICFHCGTVTFTVYSYQNTGLYAIKSTGASQVFGYYYSATIGSAPATITSGLVNNGLTTTPAIFLTKA